MKHQLKCENWVDDDGLPAGGDVKCRGFLVTWQRGPVPREKDGSLDPAKSNGAFVEDLLEAVKQRLEWYQIACGERFACKENEEAIDSVKNALLVLDLREQGRLARGVAGTNER